MLTFKGGWQVILHITHSLKQSGTEPGFEPGGAKA